MKKQTLAICLVALIVAWVFADLMKVSEQPVEAQGAATAAPTVDPASCALPNDMEGTLAFKDITDVTLYSQPIVLARDPFKYREAETINQNVVIYVIVSDKSNGNCFGWVGANTKTQAGRWVKLDSSELKAMKTRPAPTAEPTAAATSTSGN